MSNKTYLIRGTSAHVGNVAEYEEILGRKLNTEQDENGNHTFWELFAEVNGVVFSITHHGTIGRKAWTKTHPLDSLAANVLIEATRSKQIIPDVIVRSHLHTFADTHDNYPVRVVQTPCWQLSTEFAYRIGAGLPDIGGVVFHCEDDAYYMTKKIYKPEVSTPVTL